MALRRTAVTQIAVVPWNVSIDLTLLARVAAALQRQVHEHFAPLWQVDASVSAFHDWNSVPVGYWRLALVDKPASGSLGCHKARGVDGLPYALVGAAQDGWPVVASHELLEMLADPTGCAVRKGRSPVDGQAAEILLEVCDPCQGPNWSYKIDGISVSDFCTPAFYDGGKGPWSYAGHIRTAGQILKDGYMIWRDSADQEWWRRDWINAEQVDYALGKIAPDVNCLRGHIDRITRRQRQRPRSRRAGKAISPVSRTAKSKSAALSREVAAALGQERTRTRRK
jgi:hypothetical protein